MTRDWRFIETTKYDEKTGEADYSPAKKEFSGQPHPVRYLAATVTFESGESLQGHLYTTTIYLKTKEKTLRWVLRSKEQGKEGQSLDDLVYVEHIRMLDEQKDMAAQVKVKLTGVKLGPKDAVQALTRESMTPVPTKITGEDTCVVTSTFGEDFYLALRQDGKYVVGWPAQKDAELFALAQDHLKRARDFYNERQLLGAILSPDGREVLTLVNLRRRVAPTNFGEIGGEWDKERGALVEPWRLSLWRWKYDRQNRELALATAWHVLSADLPAEGPHAASGAIGISLAHAAPGGHGHRGCEMIRRRHTDTRVREPGCRVQGPVAGVVAKGRRIMIANRLTVGALICMAAALGMWLPLCLLDNALHLPPGLRLALSLGALVSLVWLLWTNVVQPGLRPQSLSHAALTLERLFEIPENLLINALCFEGRHFHAAEKPFARETVKAALAQMPAADLGELWERRRIARWAIPIAIILLLWSIYALAFGRQAANALARYLSPLSDTPPAGSLILEVTPDHDVTLSEGDDLNVAVRIGGRVETLRSYPQIIWRDDGTPIDPEQRTGEKTTMRAASGASGEFNHTFAKVNRSFEFRVFAGDTYSSNIKVTVNRIPRIAESHFRVTPPPYTGLDAVDSMGPPEPLSGLPDSPALVTIRLDKKAERLRWKTADETIEFEQVEGQWQAKTRLRKPGTYEIDVRVSEASKDVTIASGSIFLRQDAPPQVEFETESNRLLVDPGQRLQLPIRASDDFGIRQLEATLRQSQADSNAVSLQKWTYEGPPGKKGPLTETLLLTIDSARFQPGNSYILEASGRDFCPQGNTGRSQPLTIQVKALNELTVSADAPAAGAFDALDKAIQAQQTALGATRNLAANLDDVIVSTRKASENAEALGRHRDELSKKQGRVGECMTEAWNASTEPRPSFVQKLVALRDGEHKQAMDKIKTLSPAGKDPDKAGAEGARS